MTDIRTRCKTDENKKDKTKYSKQIILYNDKKKKGKCMYIFILDFFPATYSCSKSNNLTWTIREICDIAF